MRHTDWCRIRFSPTSDPGAASALIPQARTMLGQMMQGLELVGQRTGILRRQLPNGSTIVVQFDGTTPMIDIDVPAEEGSESSTEPYNLWLPRGFVVRAASADHPGGVGLPVVLDSLKTNPEDPINLAPGLATDRWTDGGGLGEVLLSKDADAGFLRRSAEIAPLLYQRTLGPHLLGGEASALEQRDDSGEWQAFRLELAAWDTFHPDESAGAKRALWQAINAHRADLGLTAMELWPRGYYRPGQLMANVMQANGNLGPESTGYPVTYRSPGERLTKDGYPLDLAASDDASSRAAAGGATELRHSGGSAATVLAAWLADADTKAAIDQDSPHTLLLDVGYRAGFWTATITAREHWIAAGNCQWAPGDGRMPPLSWHGFRSLNLGFETWPVGFTGDSSNPVTPIHSFVEEGECWLRYYRTPQASEPAMGRHIYHRGRAIAVAPPGALVWAAGVIDMGTADRLVLLAHHDADQPANNLANGMTRYLRVWWCDVPRADIALRPDRVICGTSAGDSYAWRGGTKLDVGIMPKAAERPSGDGPNALKYTSAWRFSPDGRRAVCLRDYGDLPFYADFQSATTATLAYGQFPRALELVFSPTDIGMDVALAWQPLVPAWTTDARSGTTLPLMAVPAGATTSEGAAWPLAVDYDAAGQLVYAFKADCAILSVADINKITYLGTGTGDTVYASAMQNLVLAGAEIRTAEGDFRHTGHLQVLDVRSGAFLVEGTRARLQMNDGTGVSEPNPDYEPCRTFTSTPVHGLRAWRGAALLTERWYPCPDGVVFQILDLCDSSTTGTPVFYVVEPARAMSRFVQGSFAQRGEDWVFSAQVSPQPAVSIVRDTGFADGHCGCQTSVDDYGTRAHFMAPDELFPRGGQFTSSFAMPSALAAGAWLLDAKAV